jgi:predicted ArsR family transcriptional regulator
LQQTRQAILEQLQSVDEATVTALAQATGVAPVTVRRHMRLLRRQGLVEASARPQGRGRPASRYRLTPAGADSLCGRPMERLAAELLWAAESGGRRSLAETVGRIARQTAAPASRRVAGAPLAVRLQAAVDLLRSRGFTLTLEADGNGFVLEGQGCPYERLVQRHEELCLLDQEILRDIVGARVSREVPRRSARGSCAFRIGPA